jgi:hypothetical protein
MAFAGIGCFTAGSTSVFDAEPARGTSVHVFTKGLMRVNAREWGIERRVDDLPGRSKHVRYRVGSNQTHVRRELTPAEFERIKKRGR